MAYIKGKYSFILDGINYKDINGFNYDDTPKNIRINVAGTAQMVRQWMKQKYPQIPSSYYWVRSDSYANGNSIDVYLNNAPQDFYDKLNNELSNKFKDGVFNPMNDSYEYTKKAESTAEGLKIDYGTKYIFLKNYPPSDVKVNAVNWDTSETAKQPKPTPTTSDTPKTTHPIGEVLKDCSGWLISKKNLPDGRIVYNAKIKPDTPVNREQWQEIKNEVYINTGFKWSKYGSFQKWGQIASEAAVFEILCNTLGKYYSSKTESTQQNKGNKIYGILINEKYGHEGDIIDIVGISKIGIEEKDFTYEGILFEYNTRPKHYFVRNNFIVEGDIIEYYLLDKDGVRVGSFDFEILEIKNRETIKIKELSLGREENLDLTTIRWQYNPINIKKYYNLHEIFDSRPQSEEPKEEKNIGLYLNGEFIDNVASQADAFEMLSQNFGKAKFEEMVEKGMAYYNMSKNRIDVLRDMFIYGYKWSVPKKFGNDLQFDFINKGFKVYSSAKNGQLVIYKKDMASDGLIINDNGGEFNIDKYGYNVSVGTINYVYGDANYAVSTPNLAERIEEIYNEERGGKSNEEEPKDTSKSSKENMQKAIKGLQYLADKGNEKAAKAIKGLEYLLNK